MRRLPVYLLIDTSGSMRGEPIEAVNNGLGTMVASLRTDPHALDNVHISIITFDREPKVVCPLTALDVFSPPVLATPDSGPTHLGAALELLGDSMLRDVRRAGPDRKSDWAPLLFVMTDGKPCDTMLFGEQTARVKSLGFANIVGCAAGPAAQRAALEQFCDHVALLDTLDSAGFSQFFRWVSDAIAGGSRSQGVGARSVSLPPPPSEIKLVL